MLDLAIVIVNYNVSELLYRCLDSVYNSRGDLKFEVCVVDNISEDDSVAMVRREFPQVKLIANKENVGYPAGNNQGLRRLGVLGQPGEGQPRYGLLLNPDTVIPANALSDLVEYLDLHPEIGVVGPKVVMEDGNLDLACRRSFPTPTISFYRMAGLSRLFPKSQRFGRYNMTYLDEDLLTEVDSVVGAFMMVRTAAIERVGLMDETFWMYGEDLDWCKRIKDQGFKVVYNPAVTVLHVKRASSRQNDRTDLEFYRAMLIFYYKHYYHETPWYLHWPIMLGIVLKGGRSIIKDVKGGEAILRLGVED